MKHSIKRSKRYKLLPPALKRAVDFLLDSEPVAHLTGKEFQKDGVPLTEKVAKFYRENYGGKVENPELGVVQLDKKSIRTSFSHGMGPEKAATYAAVPEIIRKGIIYNKQSNWKNRGYDTAIVIAPFKMNKKIYFGEVIIEIKPNKQNFYLHEVEIKEKLVDVFKTATRGTSTSFLKTADVFHTQKGCTPASSKLIITHLLRDFNPSRQKVNKYKVAFPHMGTVSIAWAAGLKKVGIEPFVPPYTSKRTLSLGTKHSPEAVCLPYKLILGNFIEAIEGASAGVSGVGTLSRGEQANAFSGGADYVAMITSPGICRLGEYGSCIKNALSDLGYDAKYIELRLYDGIMGMYRFLTELTGKNSPVRFLCGIIHVIRMLFLLDDLEARLSYLRAREIKPGATEKNFNRALELLKNSTGSLKKLKKEAFEVLNATRTDETKEVLHVDLTGEIYIVCDSFSNRNIMAELGRMGVEVHKTLTVSGFLKDAIIPGFFRKGETHLQRAFRLAKPYLKRDIGGDALECVSDVVYAHERGVDGVIHVSPFTCMPEIMSQNIFPAIREDLDIPVLSLIMDEQTGRAGYITRLEAFVDLLRRKKRVRSINSDTCNIS